MCGKAYDPRFVFAWPTARYAVMSGAAAAGTLVEIKIKQLERGGKEVERRRAQRIVRLRESHLRRADSTLATARPGLWIDKIIDPLETREALITALDARSLNPEVKKFNVGVLQT